MKKRGLGEDNKANTPKTPQDKSEQSKVKAALSSYLDKRWETSEINRFSGSRSSASKKDI